MSASDAFETDLLKLVFQNVNIANLGDATGVRGSVTAGSLYIALHTADPGDAGNQTTSEATYSGYARVAVARSTGAFTVSGTAPTQVANAAAVTFPACTGGTSVVTYFSIGRDTSGAGEILVSGALTSPASLSVSNGITPSFGIGALTATVD
jgi:hypothetical protein